PKLNGCHMGCSLQWRPVCWPVAGVLESPQPARPYLPADSPETATGQLHGSAVAGESPEKTRSAGTSWPEDLKWMAACPAVCFSARLTCPSLNYASHSCRQRARAYRA